MKKDLPEKNTLLKLSQRLALCDAILSQDWEHRYFSFDSFWNVSSGEKLASCRNGEGQQVFLLFSYSGVYGNIIDSDIAHRANVVSVSYLSPNFFKEPAFNISNSCAFFWNDTDSDSWSHDGIGFNETDLIRFYKSDYKKYHGWSEGYYEQEISEEAIKNIFSGQDINPSDLYLLNPDIDMAQFCIDFFEIMGTQYTR